MKSVRIIIVSDSVTFSDGLKSLLQTEPQVDVVGQETEVGSAVRLIKKLKPDAIIWASTGLREDAKQEEARLLGTMSGLKLISLNLQNNKITIYQSVRSAVRVAQGVPDLLKAINLDLLPYPKPASQSGNFGGFSPLRGT